MNYLLSKVLNLRNDVYYLELSIDIVYTMSTLLKHCAECCFVDLGPNCWQNFILVHLLL